MLSREDAQAIALTTIAAVTKEWKRTYLILEDEVLEKDFAWVFPFNTQAYVETRDVMDMALGIGPVVVNRQTGAVVVAPPMPIDRFLEQYEAALQAPN